MAPVPRMTTDEYLSTPETVQPQELIYGVLRVAEAPTPRHQSIVLAFALALTPHVGQRKLGEIYISPIDVILDEHRGLVLQPDLLFVSKPRRSIVRDRIRGAPDMVLDVLSPHPRVGRLEERMEWFGGYGVRECWLVHQLDNRMEIVTFASGAIASREEFDEHTPIRSAVLPTFDSTLAKIVA